MLSDDMIHELGIAGLAKPGDGLYEAVGCDACGATGYVGRLCVTEILVVNDTIKSTILKNAVETDIERAAIEGGMRTMYRDGMVKALAGETTVEEVLRVTREEA